MYTTQPIKEVFDFLLMSNLMSIWGSRSFTTLGAE